MGFVNRRFGAFNRISTGRLDGRKVLWWSEGVSVATFAGVVFVTATETVALYAYGDPRIA